MHAFRAGRAIGVAILTAGLLTFAAPASSQDKMKAVPKSTTPAIGGLKAPAKGRAKVSCGPKTCTCQGDDDCDALFTSTKCKEGTAKHNTRTSGGECQAAN